MKRIVRLVMNILFVVILAVGVTIWIGLPIAAWSRHWGHHIVLMCIFWGIPLLVGIIYGLIKVWKWSHEDDNPWLDATEK